MAAAIRTRGLVKKYGELEALKGVDLEVEEGEFFGLLGPNGAGKTTLISVLSTQLPATSGDAEVAGFDVRQHPADVRKTIGIVFQDPSLDEELTGEENLQFHAKLYHMPRALRQKRIDELLSIVELADRKDDVVKTYSGGMRRRLELVRGLLHHPRILFLDEPTLGLDPQTREHIWSYIRRLNKEQNVTMVLTTHYMDEADSLCDRLAIIDHGSLVARGTPRDLKEEIGGEVIYLSLNGKTSELTPVLQALADVRHVQATHDGLQLEVGQGSTAIPVILETVRGQGATVQSISLKQPTLNDVFIKHTGRGIRDEAMDASDRMSYYMRGRRR